MAEIIKDTYSLEFDSAGFESQISEAIAKVEELQGAMEDTAGSTEELDGALASLEAILKKDVKGVDELNSKQKVLATTQKNVNKESAAYGPIAKENAKNQKQLATATADATKNQKSLGGSVLDGAKKLNSLKRASSLVFGAFRLLGSFNPVGLAITGITLAVGLLGTLFTASNKAKTGLEKLNDPNLSLNERQQILQQEIDKLNELESKRGSLTEEEKKQRDDLTAKYKETSAEILRVETERTQRITELQREAARIRIKLLGDTTAAVIANAKLEFDILRDENGKFATDIIAEQNKLAKQRAALLSEADALESQNLFQEAEAKRKLADDIQSAINNTEKEITANRELTNEKERQIEVERNKELQRIANSDKEKKDAEAKRKLEENARELVEADIKQAEDDAAFRARLAADLAAYEEEQARQLAEFKKTVSIEGVQEEVKATIAARNELSEQEQRIIENNSQVRILALENERNAALLEARKTAGNQEELNKELERIDKEYSKKRAVLDAQATTEIARARIKILEDIISRSAAIGLDTTSAQKELEELKVKIVELENAALIRVDAETEPAENKLKELTKELLPLFQTVSDEIFGLLAQQASFLTERLDKAVEKSKTALDEIRGNSEDFNAAQLAEEKRRLLDLEAARRQAAQRERIIAQVQIAANAAIAISKAAAEGGVAAPFTIAATLISLIAGFAAARNAASGAFFQGTEYLERNGAPKGKDTIHIRAHEGERIVPTANNMKYWDAYSAFQNEKIPAEIANLFAKGYLSGGLSGAVGALGAPKLEGVNLRQKLGSNVVYIMQGATMQTKKLEKAINEVSEQLSNLPKKMPISTFNVNSHGLYMSTKKYIGSQEMRKERAK